MGYWLHEKHSPECDSLIKRYLNSDYIGPIRQLLQSMVNKYPNFMPDDLIELNNLFDKVISNQIDLNRYKILPIEDFFENLRNKSKN